ncbi:hypothetical protein [uncultured Acinetobacter sp.]|uniref:hypothetical protein n=1 Tax=uncultured Acinetobacter sp. TaxID=165433 RepID=UPI0025D9C9E7|nr:hypothetical protein [uncultured Acinetobacter sp.]
MTSESNFSNQTLIDSLNKLLAKDLIQLFNDHYQTPSYDSSSNECLENDLIEKIQLVINKFIDSIKNNLITQQRLSDLLTENLKLFKRDDLTKNKARFITHIFLDISRVIGIEDGFYKVINWSDGEPQEYWYRLRNAVYRRDLLEAERLLELKPELRNIRNSLGETVLHFLAVEDDLESVSWLYQRGFSLDNKTGIICEPTIFEIATLGYKELLKWFYQNGADFSAKNRDGKNILEYLEEYKEIDIDKFSDMIKFVQLLLKS